MERVPFPSISAISFKPADGHCADTKTARRPSPKSWHKRTGDAIRERREPALGELPKRGYARCLELR